MDCIQDFALVSGAIAALQSHLPKSNGSASAQVQQRVRLHWKPCKRMRGSVETISVEGLAAQALPFSTSCCCNPCPLVTTWFWVSASAGLGWKGTLGEFAILRTMLL